MSERIKSIDITKGILIILVVIGHLPFSFTRIIYFFHMPAFFILSGIFLPHGDDFKPGILWKKLRPLAFTYFTYLLLIGIPFVAFTDNPFEGALKLLLGGRALTGPLSPLWFVSALAGGIFLFFILQHFVKNTYVRLGCFIVLYLLAHLESAYFSSNVKVLFYFPLALDVSLLVAFYLFIGASMKSVLLKIAVTRKFQVWVLIPGLILSAGTVIARLKGISEYNLDMKYVVYNNLIGDILICLTFFLTFFSISSLLERFLGWLSYPGKASLTIMYLHMPVIFVTSYLTQNHIIWVAAGVLVPLVFHYLFQKNKLTNLLFLGR